MSSSVSKCPIPFFQQPQNEYMSLKKSWFFSWPTLKPSKFLFKLIILWLITNILIILVTISSLLIPQTPEKFIILDTVISNLILVVLLVRLYLGWSYIMQRLLSATVFYEESGWYDGQVWIKSSCILTQDRLIGIYEVIPLLKVITKTLATFVLLLLTEVYIYIYF